MGASEDALGATEIRHMTGCPYRDLLTGQVLGSGSDDYWKWPALVLMLACRSNAVRRRVRWQARSTTQGPTWEPVHNNRFAHFAPMLVSQLLRSISV